MTSSTNYWHNSYALPTIFLFQIVLRKKKTLNWHPPPKKKQPTRSTSPRLAPCRRHRAGSRSGGAWGRRALSGAGRRGAERGGGERGARRPALAPAPAPPPPPPPPPPAPPPSRAAAPAPGCAGVRAASARLELTRAPGVCMQSLHSADPGGCATLPSDGRCPSRPQGECCCPAEPSLAGAAACLRPGGPPPCGSGEQQTLAKQSLQQGKCQPFSLFFSPFFFFVCF